MKNLKSQSLLASAQASPSEQSVLAERSKVSRICHFGYFLIERKEFSTAIEAFDEAICWQRDYAPAWTGKGYALLKRKRYTNALCCFEKAAEFSGEPNATLWVYQAQALLGLHLPERALEFCEQALMLTPRHWAAHQVRLQALFALKRYSDIYLTIFKSGHDSRPNHAEKLPIQSLWVSTSKLKLTRRSAV